MIYKNKCLKILNSSDFLLNSRVNQFYDKTYREYGDILLDNYNIAYTYSSQHNKTEQKKRILSIITYESNSYAKDCKAYDISSVDNNRIFYPVQNKSYFMEIARVLSIDHDICEEIAVKSHNLYRKIRLELER